MGMCMCSLVTMRMCAWVGMRMCAWVGMCMCSCLLLADALAHSLCCKQAKAPQTPLGCCGLRVAASHQSPARLLSIHDGNRYYDGQLVSDDEVAAGAAVGALRDVVLAPAPADAPSGTMPAAAAAAAGKGGTSGVLLSRAYGESQLYTQVGVAAMDRVLGGLRGSGLRVGRQFMLCRAA